MVLSCSTHTPFLCFLAGALQATQSGVLLIPVVHMLRPQRHRVLVRALETQEVRLPWAAALTCKRADVFVTCHEHFAFASLTQRVVTQAPIELLDGPERNGAVATDDDVCCLLALVWKASGSINPSLVTFVAPSLNTITNCSQSRWRALVCPAPSGQQDRWPHPLRRSLRRRTKPRSCTKSHNERARRFHSSFALCNRATTASVQVRSQSTCGEALWQQSGQARGVFMQPRSVHLAHPMPLPRCRRRSGHTQSCIGLACTRHRPIGQRPRRESIPRQPAEHIVAPVHSCPTYGPHSLTCT